MSQKRLQIVDFHYDENSIERAHERVKFAAVFDEERRDRLLSDVKRIYRIHFG